MSQQQATRCPICAQPKDCGTAPGGCTCSRDPLDPIAVELLELVASHGEAGRCLCSRCAAGDVPSPCIGTCILHPVSGSCLGCRRSADEITDWLRYDAIARATVHLRLRAR